MMFHKPPGQMTIEFVVAFPAMIAVAFVAINAVLFFSDCASFDRVFRNAVCTYAASPAYEQGTGESCGLIQSQGDLFCPNVFRAHAFRKGAAFGCLWIQLSSA